MPSLLNLFRSRKDSRRPQAGGASAASADAAIVRRKPRGRVAIKSSATTRTSDSPSTVATSSASRCHRRRDEDNDNDNNSDDEEDVTLRSSDISVSIVIKEAAPMADRLLRRIASLRRIGMTSMRNDSRGDRTSEIRKCVDVAAAKAEKVRKKCKVTETVKEADIEEEEEDENTDDEAVSVSMPLPACRRRRPPIRLRDVLCWPYAAADDAADEAAAVGRMSAAEIERLYRVQSQLLQPSAGGLSAPSPTSVAPQEPPPQQSPQPLQSPSPYRGAAKEPDESSWRLLAAEQLKEFLERRRSRRAAEEAAAAAAETPTEAAPVANEGDNADVEIWRRRVYTAEQRCRLRQPQQRQSPVGDAALYCLTHELTSSATASSASSLSPSSAASLPASTTANAGSASSRLERRCPQKRPEFVFAELIPVETVAAEKPRASSDTSQDSASYLIATLRLTNGASVDRLEEPDD